MYALVVFFFSQKRADKLRLLDGQKGQINKNDGRKEEWVDAKSCRSNGAETKEGV